MTNLESKLLRLTPGEALQTLPFKDAEKLAAQFECSYKRLELSSPRYVFLKEGGAPQKRLISGCYQGETLVSGADGWSHYIDYFKMQRLNRQRLNFKFLKTGRHIEDTLIRGSSPVISQTSDDHLGAKWTGFIQNYLTPFFFNQADFKAVRSFLQILARYSGRLSEPCKIAKECKTEELNEFGTHDRVRKAVTILQAAGVWNTIAPVQGITTAKSRPTARKEVGYFFDSGFLVFLLRRRAYISDDDALRQNLFWHYVTNDIKRHLELDSSEVGIRHYWRPPATEPIIVLKDNQLLPILITYKNADNRFYRHMDYVPELSRTAKLTVQASEEFWSTENNKEHSTHVSVSYNLSVNESGSRQVTGHPIRF